MQNGTLLGHLALSFSPHPENLATAALGFVLNRSPSARQAMSQLFRQCGIDVPGPLVYHTQVAAEDQTIPDLVGFDEAGHEIILIESKFWAGLTDNQPCGYMSRLPQTVPAALVFLAPTLRIEPLWAELLRRCDGRTQGTTTQPLAGSKSIVLNDKHRLLLFTWGGVLQSLVAALDAAGDTGAAADVRQLQGLCARMDSDAFLPIRQEELAQWIPVRHRHYCELVDSVLTEAVEQGFASSRNAEGASLKTSVSADYYGRYLSLAGVTVWFGLHLKRWAKTLPTPLWVTVHCGSSELARILEVLREWELSTPPRAYRSDSGKPVIPLMLPTGVERDQVQASLLKQLAEIADKLNTRTTQPVKG